MFNKNLEHIDNLALKRRLSRISPIESRQGISYCVTPSHDYVLLKDDLPADDLQNPRAAISEMLKKTIRHQLNNRDIIINFGIGLGYLLDETFNTYPSRIFVYEPDLYLLHFVLSNVDISEHLASGRVYITNDLDELIAKISSSYITKDKIEITYLPNYAMIKNQELILLTQKVFEACKSKLVDINTITRFSKDWLYNLIDNIVSINSTNAYRLSDLESKFIGQTALIAGAGPSLADNLHNIKNNRDKFVIFAVNKTVQYLLQNDIIPDFVVCLDAGNIDRTLGGMENNYNNINAIADIRSDKAIMTKGFKKVFFNFSRTDTISEQLIHSNPDIKLYETGGSASTLALTAAVKLGFSKIIFAGIDLAFKNNVIYSYGETMTRTSQDTILVDNVQKNLVQVKSVTGSTVYTRADYQAFIHHFESLIKELNYSEIYNISSFGAYINGVKNVSFEELNLVTHSSIQPLNFVAPFKINVKEFADLEFFHINKIISILSKGTFSAALISAMMESVLIYQYMQADLLSIVQQKVDEEIANTFVDHTKTAIKTVVELLQKLN